MRRSTWCHIQIRREKIGRIRQATKEDEVISVLIETILCGWPETKADLSIKLTPYFHTRDEYTLHRPPSEAGLFEVGPLTRAWLQQTELNICVAL